MRAIEQAIGKRLPRVTVPDFDYTARAAERFEVPLADRIAEIRKRKSEERARAKVNAERRGGHGAGGSRPAGGGLGRSGGGAGSGGGRPGGGHSRPGGSSGAGSSGQGATGQGAGSRPAGGGRPGGGGPAGARGGSFAPRRPGGAPSGPRRGGNR